MKRHQEVTNYFSPLHASREGTKCICLLSIYLSIHAQILSCNSYTVVCKKYTWILCMEEHLEIMQIGCECLKDWFENRTDLGLNCLSWGYQQTTRSHLCNFYNGLHVRL